MSFEAIERAGVQVSQVDRSTRTSINIQGIPIQWNSFTGERFVFTLPSAALVSVVFGPEKVGAKLAKIFKKEVQVGDAEFDRLVYVRTSTPEDMLRLMADPESRALVLDVVRGGGGVSVDGKQITVDVSTAKGPSVERARIARFVERVLDLSPAA